MHKRSWPSFYAPKGLYYFIHLVVRRSVCNFLCAQLLLLFPSELDLFETCHNGIQSFRHPVISTPSQLDPHFGQFNTQFFFFLQKMVVSTPFIFPVPNIKPKKKSVVVNISILFFFLVVNSENYLFADVNLCILILFYYSRLVHHHLFSLVGTQSVYAL